MARRTRCRPSSPPISPARLWRQWRGLKKAGRRHAVRVALVQDLNSVVLKTDVHSPERFSGITLSERARAAGRGRQVAKRARLNRLLLADAYPKNSVTTMGSFGHEQFAATLASVGFRCFLLGRVTGALWRKKVSAHRMLGLYSVS